MALTTQIAIALAILVVASAQDCPAGNFKRRSGACIPCPRGTFQDRPNRFGCRPCPEGQVSLTKGSTNCTACPKNSSPRPSKARCDCDEGTTAGGDGACFKCKPGTFQSFIGRGQQFCEVCPQGSFQPRFGQKDCLMCLNGTRSLIGSSACFECPEDSWFDPVAFKCQTCRAGTYPDNTLGCTECPINTFKAEEGNAPCLPCPPGSHSNKGAASCKECPQGETVFIDGSCGNCNPGFFFSTKLRKCEICPVQTYISYNNLSPFCFRCRGDMFALQGSSECTTCPLGEYLRETGKCRKCPPGTEYIRNELRCRKCAVGRFNRGDSQSCKNCPGGTFSLRGATDCFSCPAGEALILPQGKCGMCPPGFEYREAFSAGAFMCVRCRGRFFKPEASNFACRKCNTGTVANEARTECITLPS